MDQKRYVDVTTNIITANAGTFAAEMLISPNLLRLPETNIIV